MEQPVMHISLYVKNIEETVSFYEKFFDQPAHKQKSDYAKFELSAPKLIISFVQNEEKVSPQFGHLGFRVDSNEELEWRLKRANVRQLEVVEEMGTNCCYAAQDKFWVSDPDGYMWEVYVFHQDVAFNDPRYASNEASACCTPPTEEKQKFKLADLNSCAPGSGCC